MDEVTLGSKTTGMSLTSCEEMVSLVLGNKIPLTPNKKYQHAFDKLKKENITFSCIDCSKIGVRARGFLQTNPLAIKICADRIKPSDVNTLVDHELLHAYDYSLGRCNFHSGEGLAYTEVRAAREGECSGWFPLEYFRTSCIKSHATRATEAFYPKDGAQFVEKVYDMAMKDLEPYHTTSSTE